MTPVNPTETVCEPAILVTSAPKVRASLGVALRPPDPREFIPAIVTLGNAPGPPTLLRSAGRPTCVTSKGTPCGLRPSAQRPHPKLVSRTSEGEMAKL